MVSSTSMMEETTRRRVLIKKKTDYQSTSRIPGLLQVPSGGGDEESSSECGAQKVAAAAKRRHKKGRRRRRRQKDEPPFYILVLQVGTVLWMICLATYHLHKWTGGSSVSTTTTTTTNYNDDDTTDDDGISNPVMEQMIQEREQAKKLETLLEKQEMEEDPIPETAPPIPTFDLSEASQWDVFGIMDKLSFDDDNNNNATASKNYKTFWNAAQGLRRRFADQYGGENAARMLLDKGLTTYFSDGVDIRSTACRLQKAQQEQRPFRLAFGGSSSTMGRGNHLDQSFPFQLQKLLQTVFSLAGIPDIKVHNAAIGGCPTFPYGWCMNNFWGETPDVVSWDSSINEPGGVPEGLEAYVRHILSTYRDSVPKLIVKDSFASASPRRAVLGEYASLLQDTVVLHTNPAVEPFLKMDKEEFRPIGFQEWRKFGAPMGAPGQESREVSNNPAVKEHELMGWILAMHFLTALEYLMGSTNELQCPTITTSSSTLPPPVSGKITNATDTSYDGILFGHNNNNNNNGNSDEWVMNPVQCRTTFQPILSGDLSELIVSGTTAEDLDVLLPKSQMYYNQGWTLDMSEDEKTAKRKLSLYENNLGFRDSKEAYYGIYESPPMKMLLPSSSSSSYSMSSSTKDGPKIGQAASDWFESIVLCQVNEKRKATACNFGSDVGIMVGGVNATSTRIVMKDAGTLYLGQPMCQKVLVPQDATLTSHNELANNGGEGNSNSDQIGVVIEVSVTNPRIVHVNQACSVSHIVWEEKKRDE